MSAGFESLFLRSVPEEPDPLIICEETCLLGRKLYWGDEGSRVQVKNEGRGAGTHRAERGHGSFHSSTNDFVGDRALILTVKVENFARSFN